MTRPASSEAVGLVDRFADAAIEVAHSPQEEFDAARDALLAHIAATEQRAEQAEARIAAALEACAEGVGDSAILDAIEAALKEPTP